MKYILAIRHVPHEGLGLLENTFAEAGLTYRYADMFNDPPVTISTSELAGLVVMGGPMNVDEVSEYPWLAREVAWIGQAIEDQVPMLGVCLGAQLLAKACGARVFPNPVKEIGWYAVERTEQARHDRLIGEFAPLETVLHWHGDTFDLPRGAVPLARSERCEQQAFRYADSAYGLQFHIELTESMIDTWLNEAGMCAELAQLDDVSAKEIRRDTALHLLTLQDLAERTFKHFAEMCQSRLQ